MADLGRLWRGRVTPEQAAGGESPIEEGAWNAFSHRSAPRSLWLAAAGSVAGLAIAGFSLFSAKGTAIRVTPPEDVALVNQQPILRSDFIAQVQAQFSEPFDQSTSAQRRKVLDDMIHEELVVQRGLELGFPSNDPDTRAALVAAVEQQAVADVTTDQPDDQQLSAFYATDPSRYASDGIMTVRDLLVPLGPGQDGAKAAEKGAQAIAAVRHGQALDAAMAAFGLQDTHKTNGEEFYFAALIHLGPRLFEVAKALRSGQVSDPVAMPDGVHLLAMTANTQPALRPFADVREQVLNDYKRARETKLRSSEEQYLHDKAQILISPELR